MKRSWKAVVAGIALFAGLSGAAFARDMDRRDTGYYQTRGDHDRDDGYNNGYGRGNRDGYYNNGYYNNGYYGYRGDGDRDDGYRNNHNRNHRDRDDHGDHDRR